MDHTTVHSANAFSRNSLLVYTTIFAISGFSGLIYESIWSHYLKLFLGHSSYAQVLVLGIFMGGMALGAAIAARISTRLRNLVMAYGICEGIIGIFGLIFHVLFVNVEAMAFETVFPTLASSDSVHFAKWTIGALLILPQSILLGATFPLLATGLLRKFPNNGGKTLATLYFVNSFGAAIGILANAFWFIPKLGLPGAILTAGLINIFLAIAVYYFTKGDDFPATQPTPTPDAKPFRHTSVLLWVAALTGLASFMYEIAWIRMLTMVLGGSTHSFEIMLSAFILGLAIGSLLIRKHIDKISNPLITLAMIQLIMGFLAVLTIPLYNYTFNLMAFVKAGLAPTDSGYLFYSLSSLLISMFVMLPVTICAGTTLPLVTHILLKNRSTDKIIGKVYAFNTLGSIVGIALAAQLVMPLMGLKMVVIGGALVDIALGIVIFYISGRMLSKQRGKLVAAIAFSSAAFLLTLVPLDTSKMASGVFRYGNATSGSQSKVIFHRDGKTSSVAVKEHGNVRILLNNGKPDAGVTMRSANESDSETQYADSGSNEPQLAAAQVDGPNHTESDKNAGEVETKKRKRVSEDQPTMVLLGTLPYIYNPNAKQIANIGLGSGVTTHTLLHKPELEKLDTIEIEQAVVDAAELFRPNVDNMFNDARSEIHIEDAKTFFATSQKTYDAIVSEPPNPWVSGVAGLFTVEFYHNIKRYLSSNGVLIQWIHLYEISPELVGTVYAALSTEFENIQLYRIGAGDAAFVASQTPLTPDYSVPFQYAGFVNELDAVNIKSPVDIQFRQLGNRTKLDIFFGPYADNANSDYFPILDVGAARTRYKHATARSIYQLSVSRGLDLLSEHKRPPLSGITEDTSIAETGQVQAAYKMLETYRALAIGEYTNNFPDSGAEKDAVRLFNVVSNCSKAESESQKKVTSTEIFAQTSRVHSFLDRSELMNLLDTVSACKLYLNAEGINWLDTLGAWIEGDLHAVLQLTDQWLNKEDAIKFPSSQNVLIFNMTARAALGQWDGYKSLQEKFAGQIARDLELHSLFHLAKLQTRFSEINNAAVEH